MLLGIYVAMWAMNVLCFIANRKSRIIEILTLLTMIVALGGFAANTGDHIAYKQAYEAHTYGNFEIGYEFFVRICSDYLGMSYHAFLTIVAIIVFLQIAYIGKQYARNGVSLVFLFGFPYLLLMTAIRFALGTSFLITGIYLFTKKKHLGAIVFLLLACVFHTSFIVLALMIVFINKSEHGILKEKSRKSYLLLAGIALFVSVIFLVFKTTILKPLIPILLERFPVYSGKILAYLTTSTNKGFLLFWGFQIANIAGVNYSYKVLSEYRSKLGESQTSDDSFACKWKYAYITKCLNLACVWLFPILIINTVFYRYFIVVYIINSILYAITIEVLLQKEQLGAISIFTTNKAIYKLILISIMLIVQTGIYFGIDSFTLSAIANNIWIG